MDRLGGAPQLVRAAQWVARNVRTALPSVRTDSLMLQLACVATGAGIALVPEPSLEHYGLVPLKLAPSLRAAAEEWPTDEVFLVTHRALRTVPRVRAVWDLFVERLAKSRLMGLSERTAREHVRRSAERQGERVLLSAMMYGDATYCVSASSP